VGAKSKGIYLKRLLSFSKHKKNQTNKIKYPSILIKGSNDIKIAEKRYFSEMNKYMARSRKKQKIISG
jgi:hypothetical protein